jgi:signal transduction histidine kinase
MNLINHLKLTLKNHAENVIYPYVFFGWFAIISYPLFYFIWRYTSLIGYENIYLRLMVVLLCLPLVAKKYWPEKIKFLLPYYWYLVLSYCLPFLFTFFLLKNNFSPSASLNFLTVTVLSVLLIDWKTVIAIFISGSSAALLVFHLWSGPVVLPNDFLIIPITSVGIMLFGALFSRNQEVVQQTKLQLQIVKSMASTIAHELRTPLRSISSYATGLEENLPILLETYEKAQTAGLNITEIFPSDYTTLQHALASIKSETQDAFTVISMLLVAAGMANALIEKEPIKICSITNCLETALKSYPFDLHEKKLIHWPAAANKTPDFQFTGKELLVKHIIFNLLKNALHHLKKAGKGEIYIWLDHDENHNFLHFKDTGTGVPKKDLPYIFDQFYSKTAHGTGIGLAFCKAAMQNLHGDIKCFSHENEFTEFLLLFPRKKNNKS